MKSKIEKILAQQTKIAEILGFYDKPKLKNAISDAQVWDLEDYLASLGWRLPESYKEFLKISDGVPNFSCSFGMLGSDYLMREEYRLEVLDAIKSGVGFACNEDCLPLMVGKNDMSSDKVFYEFLHERSLPDEPVVMEGRPGFITMHFSFYDFLDCRVEANEKTIAYLLSGS